jgi:hypothetical protein
VDATTDSSRGPFDSEPAPDRTPRSAEPSRAEIPSVDWRRIPWGAIAKLTGAFGALVYAALYVAAEEVYSPLGVAPNEVGLGYAELLVRSATYTAAAFVVGLGGFVLGQLSVRALRRLRRRSRRQSTGSSLKADASRARDSTDAELALGTAVVLSLVPLVVLITSVIHARGALQDGRVPQNLLGVSPPWDARMAQVTWTAGRAPQGLSLAQRVLYLGEDNGVTVLYDPCVHHALRVPASTVIVSIQGGQKRCPTR